MVSNSNTIQNAMEQVQQAALLSKLSCVDASSSSFSSAEIFEMLSIQSSSNFNYIELKVEYVYIILCACFRHFNVVPLCIAYLKRIDIQ